MKSEAILRDDQRILDPIMERNRFVVSPIRTGWLDEALASLDRAMFLDENDPRLAYVFAVGLQSTGALEQALEVIDQALERHPYARELLVAAVSYLVEADRIAEAQSRADQVLALEPENADICRLLESLGLRSILE
jgi:Flp pilus assembly protein TadD